MKFSYPLIKKLVPGIPSKKAFIERFNLHALETEDLSKNVLDISFTPNRYDAASHWGIAREASAIFNTPTTIQKPKLKYTKNREDVLDVRIKNNKACPRYVARAFDIPGKIGASPAWMQKVLVDCGMRPINAVVDIMNYVMLEVGQPLHAFDHDHIAKDAKGRASIIVRSAHAGETIQILGGDEYTLTEEDLLITDPEGPLAIAGIKGGKRAEATAHTKRIIVESANFDHVSIQKTAMRLRLSTDASVRFAHNLSPYLTEDGMDRAQELLEEILSAKMVDEADVYKKLPGETVISFNIDRFNALMGISMDRKTIVACLRSLGFTIKKQEDAKDDPKTFLVGVPRLRMDVSIFEDLAEEVIRMYGYDNITTKSPVIDLRPSHIEDQVRMVDQIRAIGVSLGFDEVYLYSFHSEKEQYDLGTDSNVEGVALINPIAIDKAYMRAALMPGLCVASGENRKYFNTVRIFEVGNVFSHDGEDLRVGFVVEEERDEAFLEVKGAAEALLQRSGLTDVVFMPTDTDGLLSIVIDGETAGYIKRFSKTRAGFELRLDIVRRRATEERTYLPIPRFPAIARDISMLVPLDVRVSDVLNVIQDGGGKYVEDVDLLDYFEDARLGDDVRSLTFRVVLRSENRTLTDIEADAMCDKIAETLRKTYKAEIR
jgi:phenylalanyl-tRNA synthetase beta chain